MRTALLFTVGAMALSAVTASAQVRVTMASGQVSISAKNATVAQILSEWARVGQTRIVNGERLTGAPLTLELTNVPELQALDILLRGASGYVIAPRAQPTLNGSAFDRILIVPTSNAPRAAVQAVAPSPTPVFQPTRQQFPSQAEDDAAPPRGVAPLNANQESPTSPESTPPAPSPRPTSTFGVARPGMLVPVPAAAKPPAATQP